MAPSPLVERALAHRQVEQRARFIAPLPPPKPAEWCPPPVRELQIATAQNFGFTLAHLLGTGRKKRLVIARQLAMLIARERYRLSYPELGAAFQRDHSTVMSGIRRMQRRLVEEPWLRAELEKLFPPATPPVRMRVEV